MLSEERELVSLLKQGDISAFHLLYQKYYNKLFSFCFKIVKSETDCADIVQNIFIALWEQREKIDENKLFSSYIFGIAKNIAYQTLRSRIFKTSFFERYINAEESLTNVTLDEVYYYDLKEKVDSLINQLPEKRKMIFRLSRFYGLTYQQIAAKLFITENTVDTQMRKSIGFLKEAYKKLFSSD